MTHLHWDSCPPLGVAAGPPRRCRPALLPAAKTDAKIQRLSSDPKWWKHPLIAADDGREVDVEDAGPTFHTVLLLNINRWRIPYVKLLSFRV